jgi:hypothetical protein
MALSVSGELLWERDKQAASDTADFRTFIDA